MTRDEIIKLAREARLGATLTHQGGEPRVWIEGADWHDELERFAALVSAKEREECAKVCLEEAPSLDGQLCAAAIRARGSNG
jgi:hypothetical protein